MLVMGRFGTATVRRLGSHCLVWSSVTSILPQSSVNWYPTERSLQEQQAVICAGTPYYSSSNTVVLCIAASSVYMTISTRHTSMSIW
jgi:hypothetical protein